MEDGINFQRCELCQLPSRVHCAADEASLCWECDAQVHGANFLVARHFRSLLCTQCGAPSGRFETGFRVKRKVYLCERCAHISEPASEGSEIASSASSVVSDRSSIESEGLQRSGKLRVLSDRMSSKSEALQQAERRRVVSESSTTTGVTGWEGSGKHRVDGDCEARMQAGSQSGRADLRGWEGWWSAMRDGWGSDENEMGLRKRDGRRCSSKRRLEVEADCVSSSDTGVGSVDSVIQVTKKKKKKRKKVILEAL